MMRGEQGASAVNCDFFLLYILSKCGWWAGAGNRHFMHMISSFLSRFFPPGLSGDSLYIIVHQVYDTRSECILGGIMCIVYSQFAEDVFLVRTYGKFAVESHGSYFLHTMSESYESENLLFGGCEFLWLMEGNRFQ